MPLQLYDLPFDMLEMIGEFYDDLAQREAASTLQAALTRSQQGGGTCIYCKEHGRSLAHRSKRIHGELVFALLILTSWGLHVFSRHMRTLFLHQNRLELSKGGFTGDGSSLG